METIEMAQAIAALMQSISIAGVLAWGWVSERKRADRLESNIVEDWKRQNDREPLQSDPPQ